MIHAHIREIIGQALCHEEKTGELRTRLGERLPELREALLLPETDPLDALLAFVKRYVRCVPSCLRLVTAVSKRLGFHDYAAPFLDAAQDYFLNPPTALHPRGGLEALLDESFLAHRMLEEVNDHHIRHLERTLLPIDMTEANIIVHHLLKDEFATELEQLVQDTATQLLEKEHVWERVRGLAGSSALTTPLITLESLGEPARTIRLRLAS